MDSKKTKAELIRELEALRESEEQFHTLMESSLLGMHIHRNHRLLYVNQAFARLFGYSSSQEALEIGNAFEFCAPFERDRLLGFYNARVTGGAAPARYEFQGQRKDGSLFWLENFVQVVRWNGEQAILATVLDITERKQAEEELRASQRLSQAVVDSNPHSIFVRDKEGRFLLVNRMLANRYGLTPEEFAGRQLGEMVSDLGIERDWHSYLQSDQDVLQTGRRVSLPDSLLEFPDGLSRTMHTAKSPLRNEAGEVVGVIGVTEDITERKAAEEALRESEGRVRAIADSVPVLISYVDKDQRHQFNNKTYEDWFGLAPGEFTGKHLRETLGEEAYKAIQPRVERALAGEEQVYEIEIALKNAGRRFVQVHYVPHFAKDREVLGFYAAITDFTDRQRAEEEVHRSKELLQAVVDTIPHVLYLKDTEHRFVLVNRAFADIHGKEPAQLLGVHTSELPGLTKSEKDELVKQDQEVIRRKEKVECESIVLHRKDGSTVIRRIHKTPLIDPENKIQGIVGCSEDITERKRVEDKLAENQRLLEALLEAVPVGIQVKDLEGRYLLANHAMCSMYGCTPDDIKGKTFSELGVGTEGQRAEIAEDDRKVVDLGERIVHSEGPLTLPDGRTIWRKRAKVPLFNDHGVVVGIVGLMEDLTDRKELEDQLHEVQKMEAVGILAGGVAHNFNNLLQVVSLTLATLEARMNEGKPAHDLISMAQKRVMDGSRLTGQLLAFSRHQRPELKIFSLTEVISKTMQMFSDTRKDLAFHEQYDDGLWRIKADQGQIEQLLLNLFVNAGHAMPNGGELFLSTQNIKLNEDFVRPYNLLPGIYVKITVADTGTGMSKETQERIFDPFFTTKEVGQGTGLGLSSVYGIIKNHKGIISVVSDLGRGTTFSIFLPATEEKVEDVAQLPRESRKGNGTILLVDDEEAITSICREILETSAYEVLVANNGIQAVEIFQEKSEKVDLVILDMTMPGMSGGDVFAKLKELNPAVKVIVASGYRIDDADTENLFQGITGFIQKPFEFAELAEKIHEVLNSV